MAAISAFHVTQHGQVFHCSLEIEFNALRFINYMIPRLLLNLRRGVRVIRKR